MPQARRFSVGHGWSSVTPNIHRCDLNGLDVSTPSSGSQTNGACGGGDERGDVDEGA